MMRNSVLATCLAGALLSLSTTAVLADASGGEMLKVWTVDFSGRPPFKRELIELPAADVARLEASDEVLATERIWVVNYKGKPPYRRRFEDVLVIDAASLETEQTENADRKKPLRLFKRHR